MNVYTNEAYYNQQDSILMEKLVDCDFNFYKLEITELKENSLIITSPEYFNCLENIHNLVNIKNKKILITHHHKSLARELPDFKKLIDLGFEPKNIFTITQLEYDIDFIMRDMPGTNAISHDRWLMQMFERQFIKFVFKFEEDKKQPYEMEMKRFSLFVRRFDQIRFDFMCALIANKLLDNFNYTFVNHTPPINKLVTNEQMKTLIPESLENYRTQIETWIDGIPYKVKRAEYVIPRHLEFDDYPLNLSHYFLNSRINIVFETEPESGHSYITEKTYKAMLYKKPFIIITQQNGLKALHKGGYQTFDNLIDESYDDIVDYSERVQAILKEIARLNDMPEGEFNNLINACNPIVEHNYSHLFDTAYTHIPKNFCIKALTTF